LDVEQRVQPGHGVTGDREDVVRRWLGTGEVDGDDAAVLDEHAGATRSGGEPVKQARTADHEHDATSF